TVSAWQTFETWFKFSAPIDYSSARYELFNDATDSVNGRIVRVNASLKVIDLIVFSGGLPAVIHGVAQIADANWHHVVVTLGVTQVRSSASIYLDGALDASATIIAPGGSTTAVNVAGSPTSHGFVGNVSELALYGYALNPVQVGNHYALRTSTLGDTTPAVAI